MLKQRSVQITESFSLTFLIKPMFSFLQFSDALPEKLFFLLFFFALGAIIGSFLNVVIHRVPLQESIVFPNSRCPGCGSGIKFYDNVPIISWLVFLRGKCRSCRSPIHFRYPLVELLTGLLFVVVYWDTGLTPILPIYLVFGASIVALIFIDAEHMILPDVINFPLLGLVVLTRLIYPLVFQYAPFDDLHSTPLNTLALPLWLNSIVGAALGAAAGGGSLWLVGWIWEKMRGVEAMGLGDVKMMLMVGALLGWRLTVLSIFLAAFSGALIGIALIAGQKSKDYQTRIPFGIFLGIGSLIALLFGTEIINWYLSNFVPV